MTEISPSVLAELLRQSLAQGHTPFLAISSASMAPLLKTGDQVGLETVTAERLRPGNIITIADRDDLLTHRYWGLVGEQLQTRGDRSLTFDPLWPTQQLLGRIVLRRRHGKTLSLATGPGLWLNRHLAWLMRAESRFARRKQLRRLVRRVIYLWSSLVVAIVAGLYAASLPGENQ